MVRTSDMLRSKFFSLVFVLSVIAVWAPFNFWVHRQVSFFDLALVQAFD